MCNLIGWFAGLCTSVGMSSTCNAKDHEPSATRSYLTRMLHNLWWYSLYKRLRTSLPIKYTSPKFLIRHQTFKMQSVVFISDWYLDFYHTTPWPSLAYPDLEGLGTPAQFCAQRRNVCATNGILSCDKCVLNNIPESYGWRHCARTRGCFEFWLP